MRLSGLCRVKKIAQTSEKGRQAGSYHHKVKEAIGPLKSTSPPKTVTANLAARRDSMLHIKRILMP